MPLSSDVNVVNYLLAMYATNDIIAEAIKKLESYKRGHGISAALHASRLYSGVLSCGIVYKEKSVKLLLIEDLD